MFATNLGVFGVPSYPLLLGSLYECVAQEYGLPSLERLMVGSQDVELPWPQTPGLEVYSLTNLIEKSNGKEVFSVRYLTSKAGKKKVALYISVDRTGVIQNMHWSFPSRTGRMGFSFIFSRMKDISPKQDFDFEVEGFPETGRTSYIKEKNYGAFVYIAGLDQYLHKTEDPGPLIADHGRRDLRQQNLSTSNNRPGYDRGSRS